MTSMEFHGIHGISWIHELYIVSTKFSWNPRGFHGLHEVSMEPTKFSWNPRTFHGLHEVFMESTMFSWIPRNFHGIHEGRGIHENSPRNFHEVRGIHGKANWIVPLNVLGFFISQTVWTLKMKTYAKCAFLTKSAKNRTFSSITFDLMYMICILMLYLAFTQNIL